MIDITDPQHSPKERLGWFDRLAMYFIRDERDIPFFERILFLSLAMIPAGLHFFIPGLFSWWSAGAYWAMYAYFLGPFVLMLHNTSHRRLFKHRYNWMNKYIPWVLGPFFGESPETYFAHHMGMHHPENNLPEDLSCTMKYNRSSLFHFSRYFGRFLLFGGIELPAYLFRKGRSRLGWNVVVCEWGYFAFIAGLMWVNWQATVTVWLVPLVMTRMLMMMGNWGQHAFIHADQPGNAYLNSITCVNSGYNQRCFNDGYHIGHHVTANRHWTDMPRDLIDNRERYVKEGAIVFEKIDFFLVWVFLMLKRWRWLARCYVHLGDGPRPSDDEIIALLKERTQPIPLARFAEAPQAA